MTSPERRAATNRRYYIKRKYGNQGPNLPTPIFLNQPKEVQDKILAIQAIQQKMPKNFWKPKLKDKCEICKCPTNLINHHIKYEPIEQTITVCHTCHSLIHGRNMGVKSQQQTTQKIKRKINLSYIS